MEDRPRVVDKRGNEIGLTSYQKNEIYRKAKELKATLPDKMCTKRECDNATPENVNKMLNSEFKASQQMDYYRKSMEAIGADKKDCDIEKLRRR
jgi:hypothetical protein